MVGILQDKDRIFTNLYGLHDFGLEGAKQRGAYNLVREILQQTPEWICEQIKDPARNGGKDMAALLHHMAEDSLERTRARCVPGT